jgi:hypothetical protein
MPCSQFPTILNSEHEIDNDSSQQCHRQHRGSKPIVEPTLTTPPDTLCSPMEGHKRIYHRHHGDEREQTGRDATDAVAEIQQTNGQASQDDGEIEPGEKCALVGEEDFGFDAGGKCNALAWMSSSWVSPITDVENIWMMNTNLARSGEEVERTW